MFFNDSAAIFYSSVDVYFITVFRPSRPVDDHKEIISKIMRGVSENQLVQINAHMKRPMHAFM
jgi:hypothetical protein